MATEFTASEQNYMPQPLITSTQLCQDLVLFTFVGATSDETNVGSIHLQLPMNQMCIKKP